MTSEVTKSDFKLLVETVNALAMLHAASFASIANAFEGDRQKQKTTQDDLQRAIRLLEYTVKANLKILKELSEK